MPALPPLVFDWMYGAQCEPGLSPIPTAATTPRHPPRRTRPRAFGLEEAPVFYPTWDEFQDPLRYIAWTAAPDGGNGAAYGIVKIVPPEGWRPDFVVDQNQFRFRTRVQRLNEISAERRVAQNYTEQLERFHAQQGHGRVSAPVLERNALDFYALKLAARDSGAADGTGSWADVARRLGLEGPEAAALELSLIHI